MSLNQNVYECQYCDKKFDRKEVMEKHHFQHSTDKAFSCKLCPRTFAYKSSWTCHMRLHTEDKPFSCKVCGKSCTSTSNLKTHMTTHSDKRPFSCTLCEKKFKTKSYLKTHLLRHTGEKRFECDHCDKRFFMKHALVSHLSTHTGNYPYSCKECGMGCLNKSHLRTHMKSHTNEKSFSCKVCDKKFITRHALKLHLRRHTGYRSFFCDYCKKGFVSKTVLVDHIKRHMGDFPYPCKLCGKGFVQESYLKQHMVCHANEKPFLCTVCGLRYTTKKLLNEHQKRWIGQKPYSCDICKKSFHKYVSFTNHERAHTGELPHACKICNKKFRYHCGLSRHKREEHISGKQFSCHHCDGRYSDKQKLRNHIMQHMKPEKSSNKACKNNFVESNQFRKQIPARCSIQKLSIEDQVADALKQKLRIVLIRCEAVPIAQKKSDKTSVPGINSPSSSTSGSIAETEDLQTVDSVNLAEPKHEHLIIEDETVLEYDTMHEGLDQPQSPFEKSPTCLLTKQYLGTPISIDLPEDPKHEHVDIDEEVTVDDNVECEETHQEPLQSEQKIENASGNFLTTQLFQASISPPCPVHGWKNLALKAEKALIRDATKTNCRLVLDDSKFHKQLEPLIKYEPLNIEFESILEKSTKILKPEPVKEEIEDFI